MRYVDICRRSRLFAALALLAAILSGARAPAEDSGGQSGRCFMWKVSSGANVVYLLGSIHLVPEDFYPLPKEIEDAFSQSKFLCVEVDVTKVDQVALAGKLMETGMFKGEDTLSKTLSKTTQDLLNAYCEKSGIPAATFEKFKPWFVGLMIAVLEMKKLGMREELGVDRHFISAAKDKKEILEFETADFQMQLLSAFDNDLQEKFLIQGLKNLPEMKEDLEGLMGAWKKGDPKTVEDISVLKPLRKYPEMKEAIAAIFKKILYDRNEKMAEKIEDFLKKTEPGFVVVGSMHLVGDGGIVKLLEGKKYKIEQVGRAETRAGAASAVKPAQPAGNVPEKREEPAEAK